MKSKKTLVAYYSKTGNTKKVGEKICRFLKTDIEQIIDKTERSGIKGWLIGGRDAIKKKYTKIIFKKNPSKYELVIIGTPTWAWTLTPAIRTYLKKNKKIKKVAFFCTNGGAPGKTFAEMEKLSKKPIAVLSINEKNIIFSDLNIKNFCDKLK
jgi:flavodoxin